MFASIIRMVNSLIPLQDLLFARYPGTAGDDPIATRRNETGNQQWSDLSPHETWRRKMRSTILKAALAGLLISSPLTMAFAAPGPTKYVANGQLDSILTDLSDANLRIAQERSQRLMTPAEAHGLKVELSSIRKDAIAANRDGTIPMGEYRPLMAQVENVNGQLFGESYFRWDHLN